jgi:hypothetical protein
MARYHDLYGALSSSNSNQHLPQEETEEEDHHIGMDIVGAEYSSPIKFSPDSSLAPTEDSFSTCCHTLPTLNTYDESDEDLSPVKRNSPTADSRLAMTSNFSAAYNTFNISLALALMRSSHPPSQSSSDITCCSSAVIGGMIVGQLIGGLLGDWLGRHMAMAIVMCVQVVSAVMSAFSGTLILTNNDHASSIFSLDLAVGGYIRSRLQLLPNPHRRKVIDRDHWRKCFPCKVWPISLYLSLHILLYLYLVTDQM